MARPAQPDLQATAGEVAACFVHRLFPSLRTPAALACPTDAAAAACRAAIAAAAKGKGVAAEVIDLKPDPARRLNQVTARLRAIDAVEVNGDPPWPTLLILDGFDLLEGSRNEEPTFPFRSRFQFDREHVWLFMGRNWTRLHRMFGDPRLPLYHAAVNITPQLWCGKVRGRHCNDRS